MTGIAGRPGLARGELVPVRGTAAHCLTAAKQLRERAKATRSERSALHPDEHAQSKALEEGLIDLARAYEQAAKERGPTKTLEDETDGDDEDL